MAKSARPRIVLDEGEQGSKIELALDEKLRAQGWWFDVVEADRVCEFFQRYLRHTKTKQWQGKLIVLAPWQRQKLRRLFGWRRPDGTRRYRRSSWWIPRKNGKSTIFAGIALYLQHADGEPGAEVYSAAADEDQAEVVFGEAKRMTDLSPELSARTNILKRSLFVQQTGSVYRVLTSKARTKHGLNVHGVVIDEVHAIKHRALFDVLTSASGSRLQPLELTISTAGDELGSWAYELWEYAVNVRDGRFVDPEFLPVIYAASPKDDWRSEKTWIKANPNIGISISLEAIRSEYTKAKGMPGRVAAFKQLSLNLWGQTAEAWLDIDKWGDCLVKPRRLREYRKARCWGGLDLSSTKDLTALGLVFDFGDGKPLEAAVFFWCPLDTAKEREKADNTKYVTWMDQGFIRGTPGNVVDYSIVERDIVRAAKILKLQELGYDPWGAANIVQRLQEQHGITMVELRQGWKTMSAPSKELERLILSRGIRIVENPVLTWMASHVTVDRDHKDNICPAKRLDRQRIDGIVALVMGLARASVGEDTTSVYEERGLSQL